MNYLKLLLIPLLIFFLSGCTKEYSDMTLTRIPQSDKLLASSFRTLKDTDIGDEIGVIDKNIPKKEYKKLKNWQSTDLKPGTKIYKVISLIDGAKGNFFAYKKDNKFYLFYEYYDPDNSR